MNLRLFSCLLTGHDYAYAGVVLDREVERCRRCGRVRMRARGGRGRQVPAEAGVDGDRLPVQSSTA
jgi:hypothetical protein